MAKTYNFTVKFTRADEDHKRVYEVGYNAYGSHIDGTDIDTVEKAEAQVRRRNAHLTITSVVLSAVMNEDGMIIETGADEIAEAGPGTWSVRFDDNSPVHVLVPPGSNLRKEINRRWPGVSESSVAIQADPVKGGL
jgi:hypothetical protein